MKRLAANLLITGLILGSTAIPALLIKPDSSLQAQGTEELRPEGNASASEFSYRFYGQNIPLNLSEDQIAVEFKPQTAGVRDPNYKPNYLKLEQALRSADTRTTTRGSAPALKLNIEVQPLGSRYALVTLPKTRVRGFEDTLNERLAQPYVAGQLPVFHQSDREAAIVLPNEIVISFEPGTSASRAKATLTRFGLDIIRPLRFTKNRYLVKSSQESGTGVLNVANQLTTIAGVQSATPNFVQTIPYGVGTLSPDDRTLTDSAPRSEDFSKVAAKLNLSSTDDNPLLPLHWHLDSRPKQKVLRPRTDVRATDAWQQGTEGEGTVVAVIDSLIQWDHPDLANNLYRVGDDVEDRLPGEVHGWDFTSDYNSCDRQTCHAGDPDTRISQAELAELGPHLQNTFALSTDELLQEYSHWAKLLQANYPNLTPKQVANLIRNYLQGKISGEFHGTWSAGVIAASPAQQLGAVGVAPKAKILPVRVFGLHGQITTESLIEAVAYSAARGVDVINMSLGGLMPNQDFVDEIFTIQEEHPDLVIVASAGNSNLDGVGFPAAIPGVLSVGAINLEGNRTAYSNYGGQLDVVAPGGDTSQRQSGGILTTGGTGLETWWSGIEPPKFGGWGVALDPKGQYVQVQGTSFSAPATAGVIALMRSADPEGRLGREQLLDIVRETSSYDSLNITRADRNNYRIQKEIGFGTVYGQGMLVNRPSGIPVRPEVVSAEQYYFGKGLVNAAAAVAQTRQQAAQQ